jgi:hypothetical protein
MTLIAIDNGQREAGIIDVDPSIDLTQVQYQTAMYGFTAYEYDLDGRAAPLPDQRVATLQELDNYLRTVPRI